MPTLRLSSAAPTSRMRLISLTQATTPIGFCGHFNLSGKRYFDIRAICSRSLVPSCPRSLSPRRSDEGRNRCSEILDLYTVSRKSDRAAHTTSAPPWAFILIARTFMPEEIADGGDSRASGVDFEGRGSRDLRWPRAACLLWSAHCEKADADGAVIIRRAVTVHPSAKSFLHDQDPQPTLANYLCSFSPTHMECDSSQ